MESVEFGKIPNFYTEQEKEVCSKIYEVLNELQYEDVRDEMEIVRKLARLNEIVIIYPQSDDIISFDGALINEIYCYDSCSIRFDKYGDILENKCDDECCPYFREKLEQYDVKVTADFDSTEGFLITCKDGVHFLLREENKLIARGVIVPRRFL